MKILDLAAYLKMDYECYLRGDKMLPLNPGDVYEDGLGRWNRVISKVPGKECGYYVVDNTKAMLELLPLIYRILRRK